MKREQGKAPRNNLPRQRFSVLLWRLLAAFQIFFFSPFRCFKKSLFCPLGGDCTVISQTDTRAVASQKKKTSLFYIIHTNSIALSVAHTKEEHVKEEATREEKREEKRERVSKPLLFPLNKTHTHTEREKAEKEI